MNIRKKFEDEALTIFCSRCKKRHPLKNCPLNDVSLCAEDHETDSFPSLPRLQAIYKGASEPVGQVIQVAQRSHGRLDRKACLQIHTCNLILMHSGINGSI